MTALEDIDLELTWNEVQKECASHKRLSQVIIVDMIISKTKLDKDTCWSLLDVFIDLRLVVPDSRGYWHLKP